MVVDSSPFVAVKRQKLFTYGLIFGGITLLTLWRGTPTTKWIIEVHQPLSGFQPWPSNKTDKTFQRIVEQSLYIQALAKQKANASACADSHLKCETNNTSPERRMIFILLAGTYYYEPLIEGNELFRKRNCPISDCFLSANYTKYKTTADVLLIQFMNQNDVKKYLPKPSHQIWIARMHESPRLNRVDPLAVRHLINWTINYRRDSTIPSPYGFMTIRKQSDTDSRPTGAPPEPSIDYAAGRRRKVVWMVSNCADTRNGRAKYVAELNKYIPVDTYGECGKFKCRKNESRLCFHIVEKNYKFYLAFENSNCRDYITEKLFHNALRHNIVPVVMGAHPQDYADVLPPHSYIHVDDFRSPKELASYLRMLDANDTLYNEYFQWKRNWKFDGSDWWCRMCGLLHAARNSQPPYVHWYSDYANWWNGACNAHWAKEGRWQTWRQ